MGCGVATGKFPVLVDGDVSFLGRFLDTSPAIMGIHFKMITFAGYFRIFVLMDLYLRFNNLALL